MSSHSHRVRLVGFDLDGTLIRGATICESLAAPLGKAPSYPPRSLMRCMRPRADLREIAQLILAR